MRHNYLSADLAGEIGGQNRHIVLFGQVGSGKTSIFNLLVSNKKNIEQKSTKKYSPIVGSCRLGHIGEVTLIDTAGLNDVSELNGENATTVRNIVRRADIAIYVINIQEFNEEARETYQHACDWLVKNDVPYLQVFNRCDEAYAETLQNSRWNSRTLFLFQPIRLVRYRCCVLVCRRWCAQARTLRAH